jgi:two-component system sensor histidine kinase BaeS
VRRKILIATALVASVTIVMGLTTAFATSSQVQARAADELARQASVTAALIEQDLDDLRFRPGADVAEQIAQFRTALLRSLNRARVLGGHDVVEAVLFVRDRRIPISEPLVVIPLLPEDLGDGDVVTVDVDGTSMLVGVQEVDVRAGSLAVAIARAEPLFPIRGLTTALLVALGIGAVLTISLGVWFSTSLSRRLAGISEAAREVGAGDLAARAPASGDDEIAAVAASFNDMASELQAVRDREREFLMAVSHDLRTPLTTIAGYAEALDAGDISPEDLSRVAAILHAQTNQLARLVEDVMALARLESREFTLRTQTVELEGLVLATVETFLNKASSAAIHMTADEVESVSVIVDPDRLIQVLGNLIENALRYTPEGGSISVGCRAAGDGRATITVANSGAGIAAHDLPHVFERLYVAERYRAVRPAGSGLGLAIVAEIVDAMGGSIDCTSPREGGTVFTVTIG